MSFAWPLVLLGLLAVPLLGLAYWWQLRRRRKQAVRYSSVALLKSVLPKQPGRRRHIPVILLLAGISALGLAAARPKRAVAVPLGRTSIILALDVSRSMCATDVDPNRMSAAQAAARDFIHDQPGGTRIGIVAFAGFAQVVVAPTTNKDELATAVDNLTTARGTAIGAATLKSIEAIAEINPDVAPLDGTSNSLDTGIDPTSSGDPDLPRSPADATPVPPPPGGYIPDIVVLLTDGANTRGIVPLDAAQQAVARRIRVYTIGFGTTNPSDLACTRAQLGSEVFGSDQNFPQGGGGGGFNTARLIDEPTLQEMARQTGGTYHRAEDADQLKQVFKELPRQVGLQKKEREISVFFAALGLVLTALAIALSLKWNS
jgi:Ca-activated chloride channel homolog